MKLSDKCKKVLQEMQAGEQAVYNPYRGRFNPTPYYHCGAFHRCTREVKKLLSLELAEKYKVRGGVYDSHRVRLTQAGKDYKIEDMPQPVDMWKVEHWQEWHISIKKIIATPLTDAKCISGNCEELYKTKDHTIHKTREAAYDHAIIICKNRVSRAESELLSAQARLDMFQEDKEKKEL